MSNFSEKNTNEVSEVKNKIQEVKINENVITLEDGIKLPIPLFMNLGNTYIGHNEQFVITKNQNGILSFIPNDGSINFIFNKQV